MTTSMTPPTATSNKTTLTPPATASILTLTTSSPSSKRTTTTTTSTVRSVITKKKPDTTTKERSTPRCRCQNLRSTTLPFSDLRHCLINAVVESLRHDDACRQKERTNLREQSEEMFGRLQHRSRPRQHFSPGFSTKSRGIQKQQRPPRGPFKRWPRPLNNRSRLSSGGKPSTSETSWSGLRRPWLHKQSQTTNWNGRFGRGLSSQ